MLDKRFWDKVKKTDSCWFWTSAKRDGYGMYYFDGSNRSAHRFLYERVVGEIPQGKELDHICMNRNCVNPDHLEPVDRITNLERGRNFGRSSKSKKSFLLYIHNPSFKSERRKSELVNRLLEEHYTNEGLPLATKPATNPIIKTKEDALKAVKPLARDDKWAGPLWKKGKK